MSLKTVLTGVLIAASGAGEVQAGRGEPGEPEQVVGEGWEGDCQSGGSQGGFR